MAKQTQYRKPTLESLEDRTKWRSSEDQKIKALLGKYKKQFKAKDKNGAWIDDRTGEKWSDTDAIKYINLNKFGTETPLKDYEYLKRTKEIDKKEETGPLGIRRKLSQKGEGFSKDGTKYVDIEHDQYIERKREELEQLKKQTSFAIDNKEVEVSADPTILSSSIRGQQKADLADKALNTGGEGGDDEEDDTSSGVIEQVPRGDDGQQADAENKGELKKNIDRQIAVAKNEEYLKSVSWNGMNETYTTNYREAVKNAAGWSRFYDDQDEAGNPIEKSDVFTRGEDGQPLGVMTRSQRRAYDMRMHEAKMNQQHQKNADKATGGSGVYGEKGKVTTTEWTTDQEANEAGKVITGGESAKADASKVTENITPKTSDILDKDKK